MFNRDEMFSLNNKMMSMKICVVNQERGWYISKTFITNKTMSNRIIESSVGSKHVNDTSHSDSSTSKHTKHTTIISTKTADDALQLFTIKCPSSAMFIHVGFEMFIRLSSKRIKVFSTSIGVHVNSNPMLAGFRRLVCIAHQ